MDMEYLKIKLAIYLKNFIKLIPVQQESTGSGLGLVICKGIVEAHGGKIWVDKNQKNGFSIKFTLPIYNSHNIAVIK